MDCLKTNEDIGGLAEFVARDVREKVDTNNPYIIEEVINLLKGKFQKYNPGENVRYCTRYTDI